MRMASCVPRGLRSVQNIRHFRPVGWLARSTTRSLSDSVSSSCASVWLRAPSDSSSCMVRELSIEPQRWGRRDKHLEVAQVLQIARFAQRASLEEVAGSILEWTEQNHPDAVEQTATEIDAFFAELPRSGGYTCRRVSHRATCCVAASLSEQGRDDLARLREQRDYCLHSIDSQTERGRLSARPGRLDMRAVALG